MTDNELAARWATAAGRLLLDVRTELADASEAERKAAGDKRSHDFLMESLAAERPDDAVLSEEGADNPVRLTAERVWIVDPLDDTREFSELGRDDWAVHVALWQSRELVAGARRHAGHPDRDHHPQRRRRRGSWCLAPGRRRSPWQCAMR